MVSNWIYTISEKKTTNEKMVFIMKSFGNKYLSGCKNLRIKKNYIWICVEVIISIISFILVDIW